MQYSTLFVVNIVVNMMRRWALASVMGVPHTVGALLVHDEESARSELERLYQRYGKEEVVVGKFV